jgi:hypothetical protein
VDAPSFWNWLKTTPSFVFVKMVWDDLWKLAVLWTALYLFHFLPKYMPVPGFAGRLIEAIHQAGSVAVAALLVYFLIMDVWASRSKRVK